MKDSDTLETLQRRKTKWDKIVNTLKLALGVYAFLVLTFLAVQGIIAQQQIASVLIEVEKTTTAVRDSQVANQKTGTDNHEKTRAYIKCLFTEVLTVPLSQRTEVDFDTCTRQVDTESTNTDTQPSSNNATPQPNIAPIPSPTQNEPKPSEPSPTAPPDPEPDQPQGLREIPLVDGVLKLLGL